MGRNRWVWHFDAEAGSLKFKRSWKDVSKHGPVVLGSLYVSSTSAAELYVSSIDRAWMAVTFFDEIPRPRGPDELSTAVAGPKFSLRETLPAAPVRRSA